MEARTDLNNRLTGRHVTEGSTAARQPGRYDAARGRGAQLDDAASANLANPPAFALSDGADVFKRTPYIADLKPAGRFVAKDLADGGNIPLAIKTLLKNGFLHGECLTVTGSSMAEKLRRRVSNLNRDAVPAVSRPLPATGGAWGLRGNLLSNGAIVDTGLGHFRDGDMAVDAECGSLDTELSDTEFEERPARRQPAFGSGYLGRFSCQVGTARYGAVAPPGESAEKTCYANI
jgi:dihydroxyacid dehydratase/phosphogluconate dehydratase